MRIELVEADVDNGIHCHPELWVRVLSNEPLSDKDWATKVVKSMPVGALEAYASSPCGFWCPETNEEAEEAGYGFEQWWYFPLRGA